MPRQRNDARAAIPVAAGTLHVTQGNTDRGVLAVCAVFVFVGAVLLGAF